MTILLLLINKNTEFRKNSKKISPFEKMVFSFSFFYMRRKEMGTKLSRVLVKVKYVLNGTYKIEHQKNTFTYLVCYSRKNLIFLLFKILVISFFIKKHFQINVIHFENFINFSRLLFLASFQCILKKQNGLKSDKNAILSGQKAVKKWCLQGPCI